MTNLITRSAARLLYPFMRKAAPYLFVDNNPSLYKRLDNKFRTLAEYGYKSNSIVYSAINYKMRAISAAPLRAYTNDLSNPQLLPLSHPLQQLIQRPNPLWGGIRLQIWRSMMLNLAGNSFIIIERDDAGAPLNLWPVRPDKIAILVKGSSQVGFGYIPNPTRPDNVIPVLREDMLFDSFMDPLDDFEGLGRGMSPLEPVVVPIDVDNKFGAFLGKLVQTGLMPTGMFTSDQTLSDPIAKKIKDRYTRIYGGAEKWADVMVLGNNLRFEKMGMNLNELSFQDMDRRNEARILQVLGINPTLLGSVLGMEESHYQNFQEARKDFWEDKFPFELRLLSEEFNMRLSPDNKVQFIHDLSAVPALIDDLHRQTETAKHFFEMGVPPNEALRRVGINITDFEAGDDSYMGSQLTNITLTEGQPNPALVEADESDLPVLPEPTDDEADLEDQDADDTDGEERVVSRVVLFKLVESIEIELLALSNLEPSTIRQYFADYANDSVRYVLADSQLSPYGVTIQALVNELRIISESVCISAEATNQPSLILQQSLRAVYTGLRAGIPVARDVPNIPEPTRQRIRYLTDLVHHGSIIRQHHSEVLFTDGVVTITDTDIDAAIAAVEDHPELHALLTAGTD